jgi:hypothetical protein
MIIPIDFLKNTKTNIRNGSSMPRIISDDEYSVEPTLTKEFLALTMI